MLLALPGFVALLSRAAAASDLRSRYICSHVHAAIAALVCSGSPEVTHNLWTVCGQLGGRLGSVRAFLGASGVLGVELGASAQLADRSAPGGNGCPYG